MASNRFLAILIVILLACVKTQAYDHHHVHEIESEEHFSARAFSLRRTLLQDNSPKIVRVDDFGDVGNGTDATEAFENAWNEACSSEGSVNFVVRRRSYFYLLRPITFKGPCKAEKIAFQLQGSVRASTNMSEYNQYWILFDRIQNLTVEGGGTINGWGNVWWNRPCKVHNTQPCARSPTAVTFNKCENLVVRNLRSVNPQTVHLHIHHCTNVNITGLTITAPSNSPNTDGLNVRETTNISISDCVIGTGDDCIAINDATHNVRVSNITCGPGHGISIGSLGGGNRENHVSDVVVNGATLTETTNGVRIKTWQGGSGDASNIKFIDIEMNNVRNPILIDQNYCIRRNSCPKQDSAVQVRDIVYQNIRGTSNQGVAIRFDCSDNHKCEGIVLQDINLANHHRRDHTQAVCNNVDYTNVGDVSPHCPHH